MMCIIVIISRLSSIHILMYSRSIFATKFCSYHIMFNCTSPPPTSVEEESHHDNVTVIEEIRVDIDVVEEEIRRGVYRRHRRVGSVASLFLAQGILAFSSIFSNGNEE